MFCCVCYKTVPKSTLLVYRPDHSRSQKTPLHKPLSMYEAKIVL